MGDAEPPGEEMEMKTWDYGTMGWNVGGWVCRKADMGRKTEIPPARTRPWNGGVEDDGIQTESHPSIPSTPPYHPSYDEG